MENSMLRSIYDPIQVLARTDRGRIVPVLVTWKGRSYTVAKVEERSTRTIKGQIFEAIPVYVVTLKKMLLEFDHTKKSWRLLGVEDNS
jgi:hypothetical protein